MRYISYLLFCCLLTAGPAHAGLRDWLNDLMAPESVPQEQVATKGLSDDQIGQGLKQALAVGAERAIGLLAKHDGYLGDKAVRIALPDSYQTLAKGLRVLGQGEVVDDFELTMNRAAEQAIGETLNIVTDTVSDMSWRDVGTILEGPDDAATRYLQDTAGARMQAAVKPLVADATEKSGATKAYKRFHSAVSGRGIGRLLNADSFDLDTYVTDMALQGLFVKLADEERKIREDPLARTTDLLKQVFNSN